MAKKSSGGSAKKKKSKSKIHKKLGILNSEAKKNKAPKENPFESIWSRSKFNILGKKQKDDQRRRIGLSRSLAIQKRDKTLLKEYEQSKKSSTFVDKRIGEQNEGLAEFDKAILRSQRERQLKLKKKSKFNLSDGEEEEFEFQDDGYFRERDDFEDDEPLEGDDDADLPGEITKRQINHLGADYDPESRSGEGQDRPKTKKEVMEDIISKSKFFKAEKAKDKEENQEFIEQLDKDFASLVQSKAISSLTEPNKMSALKSLVQNTVSNDNAKKEEAPKTQNKVLIQQEKPDQYDKLVGQMALDMRARPSDRTKAPEELAQEEKERLEELEEERRKRMVAGDDPSDEDANASEDDDNNADRDSKRTKHISGDDLVDSFSDAIPRAKAIWIDDLLNKEGATDLEREDAPSSEEEEEDDDDDDDVTEDDEDEDEEEEEEEDEAKAQSLKDWEQSDDDNIDLDNEEEDESDDDSGKEADVADKKKVLANKSKQKDDAAAQRIKTNVKEVSKTSELPYTIEAPKNFEEFNTLVENRSDDQIMEAIRRIRTYNAIAVAAENRKKMQVFYGVLLQYFAVSASKNPLDFKLLNLLVKPLMEMSTEIPYFAAICARQRLLRTRTQFCDDIKNMGKSCWPSLKTLFLLRLWSMIFPCSDFRHAVTTPAILLISEYLIRCPVTSGRDIAIGSFLCSMVLSVSRQSQKLCPEALTFLQTMLMAALTNIERYKDSQLYHLMELKTLRPLLRMQGRVEEVTPLDFLTLMELPDDSTYFTSDNFRASILSAIIGNLKGFVQVHDALKSFPEIFLPTVKLLNGLAEEDLLPNALKVEMKDIVQLIEKKSEEHHSLRQPLRLRKQKVIKTAIPKFEDSFVKGRDYDPDRERVEMKKLRKKLKQEAKGAARELRKDNHFLFEVKAKEKARLDEEKAEMYGKYRAILQDQEHAFKSGQLGKNKKRRR